MAISLRRSLLICAALALLAHGVVLHVVKTEIAAMTSPIKATADPLFTRQITTQLVSVPAAAATATEQAKNIIKKPIALTKSAQAAPKKAAQNVLPEVTATLTPTTADVQPSTVLPSDVVTTTTESTSATPTTAASAANSTATYTISGTTTGSDTLALQGNWPADTRLSYVVGGYFRGDLHGSAQVQWTRDPATQGERYQVRINIDFGLAAAQFTSQGLVRATGLQPQAYEEQVPGGKRRSVKVEPYALQLQDGRLIGRPEAAALDLQDSASQFVELGHRFSTGRARLADGEVVRLWLARPGGLDEWVYDIGPAEMIVLPVLGGVQAHRLTPRPLANPRGNITAEMWMAPSLQYLPVRIQINLGKDARVDLLVEKIEQR